jgi:hypothetical protein
MMATAVGVTAVTAGVDLPETTVEPRSYSAVEDSK